MQCFIDSLVRNAKKGDTKCQHLVDMLDQDVEQEVVAEAAKISELLHSIAMDGKVFKEDSFLSSTFRNMGQNDERIVWTNDRAGDAGK